MIVVLNKHEFYMAAQVGFLRAASDIFYEKKERWGANDQWNLSIIGACGEAAVAKFLNVYWNGNIGDFKACDIPGFDKRLEVRTTALESNRLIVHQDEANESIFILVIGQGRKFRLAGWCYGSEAKNEKYWDDPTEKGRHAFFVPQNQLKQIGELKKNIKEQNVF